MFIRWRKNKEKRQARRKRILEFLALISGHVLGTMFGTKFIGLVIAGAIVILTLAVVFKYVIL